MFKFSIINYDKYRYFMIDKYVILGYTKKY